MRWWLLRLLVAFSAAASAGALAIALFGPAVFVGGMLVGLSLAFVAFLVIDGRRWRRLSQWLQGSWQEGAPRDGGLRGEIAYRAERAIRELQRGVVAERSRLSQFLAAMEASPNGVLLLDAHDVIEWCNARAADHFGLDPRRDRDQPITNLIRSPTFVGHLQGGRFVEPITLGPPERHGSLQITIRSYGSEGKKLILSQDQTERERAEAMRREFVANVSHELRTPLTVLAGFLQTMRNLPLSDVEQRRVLALMSQQSDRMTSLVGDLLTLARLEGSPRPPADSWVSLASVLAQVEAAARALSAGRHELTFGDVEDVSIAGSESELLSAIGNLVSNAVRYTPEQGRIEVRFRRGERGEGEVVVSDTGRGIAAEHLSRLAERFYRVDSGRSRDSGGTGLGLAIVKHVTQRHGGELGIESTPGSGSTFRLVLPAERVRVSLPDAGANATPEEALQGSRRPAP